MTVEEFQKKVREGVNLVILDDMVLNVRKFFMSHPGGNFVITRNIGRDVSKFFYGGYTMENYGGMAP